MGTNFMKSKTRYKLLHFLGAYQVLNCLNELWTNVATYVIGRLGLKSKLSIIESPLPMLLTVLFKAFLQKSKHCKLTLWGLRRFQFITFHYMAFAINCTRLRSNYFPIVYDRNWIFQFRQKPNFFATLPKLPTDT